MNSSSILYAFLLLLAGIVSLVVFSILRSRPRSPGSLPLLWITLAMAVWSWTYALHWLMPEFPLPFFWLDATYLGVATIPTLLFIFTAEITHHPQWLSRRNLVLLSIEPLLTVLFLWTDPLHHLFFGGFRTIDSSDIYAGGVWFWVNVIYSYLFILLCFALLINTWRRQRAPIYRRQLGVIVFGMILLFALNAIRMAGVIFLPGLDITPLAFTLMGGIFAFSLLQYRLFDLVPVPVDILIDQMVEGVIVIDDQNRIIEVNQTAAHLIGATRDHLIGQFISTALDKVPLILTHLRQKANPNMQITLPGNPPTVLDTSTKTLYDKQGKNRWHLITWRDITHLKEVEEQLVATNQQLQQRLVQIQSLQETLRNQAIRDSLTGLHNRRYIDETLPKELSRAERSGIPVVVLMMDIDEFKMINDTHGHKYGDIVLQHLAEIFLANLRKGDTVARYGGEEFLAVLVNFDNNAAFARAEELRLEVQNTSIQAEGLTLYLTISIGVASYPDHGKTAAAVIHAADQALYRAKASGRNRTVIASHTYQEDDQALHT